MPRKASNTGSASISSTPVPPKRAHRELAKHVATVPPLSIYGILHAVPRNAEADPATGYVLENLMAAMAAADPAAQERIAAFLAGRAAKIK